MIGKTMKLKLWALFALLTAASCKLDNYEAPNSTLYGSILDVETGALVEQDIINGTRLEYIEQGFQDPVEQYMVIKNDGTYNNSLVFGGKYYIRPVQGNFYPVDRQKIQVKGKLR